MAGISLAAAPALGVAAPDWDTAAPESKGMRGGVVADGLKAGEDQRGLRALLVALLQAPPSVRATAW